MKNLIKKITSFLLIIIAAACSKKECEYNVPTVCNNVEPEGFMVVTDAGFSNPYSATIYKSTFNINAPIGGDWNNPALSTNQVVSINPTGWTLAGIGSVFGIAIDNNKNIFLSATDVYNFHGGGSAPIGPAGRSGIYKTNISTPATTNTLVSTFVGNAWNYVLTNSIPNSGSGPGNSIGNIAYDKTNNQLFVTNLEDGRIYRLDATSGNVKSVFDPFVLDTPSNGMVAIGERIWGVGVLTQAGSTKVYFARSEATSNTIYSISLNASGEFIATPQAGQPNVFNDSASNSNLEIKISKPNCIISDIEFSCSGKILLAERGSPHDAKLYEYKKVSGIWTITVPLNVGITTKDVAGGAAYGDRETTTGFKKEDIIWVSQNYARPVNMPASSTYLCYGVQGINVLGNNATTYGSTDLFIDRNTGGPNNKGGMGDVDVFESSCPCNN